MSALGFLSPWILTGLLALPVIWWLLRAVPPAPIRIAFPAVRLLKGLKSDQQTPARSPWWLTLIRMLAAGLVILALAEPVLNPDEAVVSGEGPVVIAVDNGWTAAAHWPERKQMMSLLVTEAERQSRPILIAPTAAATQATTLLIDTAQSARDRLEALKPLPHDLDRAKAAEAIAAALKGEASASIYWLDDGIDDGNAVVFAERLQSLAGTGKLTVISAGPGSEPIALRMVKRDGGRLALEVLSPGGPPQEGAVVALSGRGQRLGEAAYALTPGSRMAVAELELPLELRNQIARLEIAGERSAGAVNLLDAAARWNRIGLVSGTAREKAQPLLSPLYYLERALTPYAELLRADDGSGPGGLGNLLRQNVSVLVLADIGKLVGEGEQQVKTFVETGGVLVRFAGPRLEQGGDALLPVALRLGGRTLGGALSWSTPQPLAPFEDASLFAKLPITDDVRIGRQVLADPALLSDDTKVWARLADGTPLVTAEKRGQGWIVLFHVTANSDWSNLPLSGLFVDMLQRVISLTGLVELSRQGDAAAGATSAPATDRVLRPIETLDGFGVAGPPPPNAQPLPGETAADLVASSANPPGLYGSAGALRAVNVVTPKTELKPLPTLPSGVARTVYQGGKAEPLKPWCLAAAVALVLIDILAVLLMQAGLLGRRAAPAAASALIAVALLSVTPLPSRAQTVEPVEPDDAFALRAALKPRLAYVLTGDATTDEASRMGLLGLGTVLTAKTAFEPDEPMGIDIERDELAFFPVLYWPIRTDAPTPSAAALGKIDAFMKGGGLIVFDTQDALEAVPSIDGSGTASASALQRLIGGLDIPRLEPAPPDHVITKSFYLLNGFPGRFDSSPLWVEAEEGSESAVASEPRKVDGVSAVLITGNDLAGAWAVDDIGRSLYPCVPGGEEQREFAYRVGVNIVMYALTGNYKADQVHVPALLERLGQ